MSEQDVVYDVIVPDGATATLVLAPRYNDVTIDGISLPYAGGTTTRSQLAPGRHKVTFRISSPGN